MPTDGQARREGSAPIALQPAVRLWPLAVIAGAAAVAAAWIWLAMETARSYKVLYTGQTILLMILATLLWIAFASRLAWRVRCIWLVVIILPLALLTLLVRIDKVTGDLIPIFAWRFVPKPHQTLAQPEAVAATGTPSRPEIDLSRSQPADYPEFMGRHRDATLHGIRLATDWQAHPPRQVWRQPIGGGWSSFSVVGDYAFTQEQRGPHELVTCYELKSGRLLWSYADDVYYESKIAGDGPRATPTIAAGRVYTMGSTGLVNCLDGATGKRLWQRNVLDDTLPANTDWGKACSPLIVDGQAIVTGGSARGPSLVAYHAADGELAWKANDRPTSKVSYGSPMIVTLAGARQILMLNDNTIAGYDPNDGKQLWEHDWPGSEPKVTQPLVVGSNRLAIGSGYGVGTALFELSVGDRGRLRAREIWHTRNLKPKFANLVCREGAIFGLDEGILTCLDLATGQRRWKKGRYGHGQLLLVENILLVLAEDGQLVLVEATPDAPRELATFPALEGKSWSHPVLVPPYLLLRNDHEAACYELRSHTSESQ